MKDLQERLPIAGSVDDFQNDLAADVVLLAACAFAASRSSKVLAERDPVPWLARLIESGTPVLVTIHPSYLLRIRDHDDRESERQRFISDLKSIGDHLNASLMTARQNA